MECKNCHTDLTSGSDYCHVCGAQVIRNRLSIKNLFQHLTETFFSYDNKLLQTIIYLFKSPDDVIDSYVNGVRKKYIAPLAFFAIALTFTGIYLFILKNYFPDIFNWAATSITTDDKQQEEIRKVTQKLTEYNTVFYFILIPGMALLSKIVFLKNRYNFTEHLVIYFYTMSLFSIISVGINVLMLSFVDVDYLAVSGIQYVLFFFYQCYVLKRVFNLTFKQLLIKVILFIPVFFVAYILFSILLIILFFDRVF